MEVVRGVSLAEYEWLEWVSPAGIGDKQAADKYP